MDALTFLSKLVEAIAWPVAALCLVLLLRSEIQTLIPLIKKFKAGPLEVELERVVKQLEDTKKLAESADAKAGLVAAKLDEGDDIIEPTETISKSDAKQTPPVTDLELRVLKAMVDSRFATRSMTGVAKDTNLATRTVQTTYGTLIAKGLVEQTKNAEGKLRWFPTILGRVIANEN